MDLVDGVEGTCSLLLENLQFNSHPIIQSFLSCKKHYELYQNVMLEPSKENITELDSAFKIFFYEIRLIKYTTNLIKYYVLETIKRYRKHFERNLYILDSNVSFEAEGRSLALENYLSTDETSDPAWLFEHNCSDLLSCIGNDNLR